MCRAFHLCERRRQRFKVQPVTSYPQPHEDRPLSALYGGVTGLFDNEVSCIYIQRTHDLQILAIFAYRQSLRELREVQITLLIAHRAGVFAISIESRAQVRHREGIAVTLDQG